VTENPAICQCDRVGIKGMGDVAAALGRVLDESRATGLSVRFFSVTIPLCDAPAP
jgi:hypothetical protein